MKVRVRLAVVTALALSAGMPLAHAADAPGNAELIKRLNEQEQRIRALEQKLAEQQQANGARATAANGSGAAASNRSGARRIPELLSFSFS